MNFFSHQWQYFLSSGACPAVFSGFVFGERREIFFTTEQQEERLKPEKSQKNPDQIDAEVLENADEKIKTAVKDDKKLQETDQNILASLERGKKAVQTPDTENIISHDLENILQKLGEENSKEYLESPDFEQHIDTVIFFLTRQLQQEIEFKKLNGKLEKKSEANEIFEQYINGKFSEDSDAFTKSSAEVIKILNASNHPNAKVVTGWWGMEVSSAVFTARAEFLQSQNKQEKIPEDPVVQRSAEEMKKAEEKIESAKEPTGIFEKLKEGISSLWGLEFLPEKYRGGFTGFAARSFMVWAVWEVVSAGMKRAKKIISGEEKVDKKNMGMLKWVLGALGIGAAGKFGWDALKGADIPDWIKPFVPDEVLDMWEKGKKLKEKAGEVKEKVEGYAKVILEKKNALLAEYPWIGEMADDIFPSGEELKAFAEKHKIALGTTGGILGLYFLKSGGIGFLLKTIISVPGKAIGMMARLAKGGAGMMLRHPFFALGGMALALGAMPRMASAEDTKKEVEKFFTIGEGRNFWNKTLEEIPVLLNWAKSVSGFNNTEVQENEKNSVVQFLDNLSKKVLEKNVPPEKQDDKQALISKISLAKIPLSSEGSQKIDFGDIANLAMRIGMKVEVLGSKEEAGIPKYKYSIAGLEIPVWVNNELDKPDLKNDIANKLEELKEEWWDKGGAQNILTSYGQFLNMDLSQKINWEKISLSVQQKLYSGKEKISEVVYSKSFLFTTLSLTLTSLLLNRARKIKPASSIIGFLGKKALKYGGIIMIYELIKRGIDPAEMKSFQNLMRQTQNFIGKSFDIALPPRQREKIKSLFGDGLEEIQTLFGFEMGDDSLEISDKKAEIFSKKLQTLHTKIQKNPEYKKYNDNIEGENMDEIYQILLEGLQKGKTLRSYYFEKYISHLDALKIPISVVYEDGYILTLGEEKFPKSEINFYPTISTEKDTEEKMNEVMREQIIGLQSKIKKIQLAKYEHLSKSKNFDLLLRVLDDLLKNEEDFMDFYAIQESNIHRLLQETEGVEIKKEENQYFVIFRENEKEVASCPLLHSEISLKNFSQDITYLEHSDEWLPQLSQIERTAENIFFQSLIKNVKKYSPEYSVVQAKAKRLEQEMDEGREGERWNFVREVVLSGDYEISMASNGNLLFTVASGGNGFELSSPTSVAYMFMGASLITGTAGGIIGLASGAFGITSVSSRFNFINGAKVPWKITKGAMKLTWKTGKFLYHTPGAINTTKHVVTHASSGIRMLGSNILSGITRKRPFLSNHEKYKRDYLIAKRKIMYFSIQSQERGVIGMGNKVEKWGKDLASAKENFLQSVEDVMKGDPKKIPSEWKTPDGKLRSLDEIIDVIEKQDPALARIQNTPHAKINSKAIQLEIKLQKTQEKLSKLQQKNPAFLKQSEIKKIKKLKKQLKTLSSEFSQIQTEFQNVNKTYTPHFSNTPDILQRAGTFPDLPETTGEKIVRNAKAGAKDIAHQASEKAKKAGTQTLQKTAKDLSDMGERIAHGSGEGIGTGGRIAQGVAGLGAVAGTYGTVSHFAEAINEENKQKAGVDAAQGAVDAAAVGVDLLAMTNMSGKVAGRAAGAAGLAALPVQYAIQASLSSIEETTKDTRFYNRKTKDGYAFSESALFHLLATTQDATFGDFMKSSITSFFSDFTMEEMEEINKMDKIEIRKMIWKSLILRRGISDIRKIYSLFDYIREHTENFDPKDPFEARKILKNAETFAQKMAEKNYSFSPQEAQEPLRKRMDDIVSQGKKQYETIKEAKADSSFSAGLYAVAQLFGYEGEATESALQKFFTPQDKRSQGIYYEDKQWYLYDESAFIWDTKIEGETPKEKARNMRIALAKGKDHLFAFRERKIVDSVIELGNYETESTQKSKAWGQKIYETYLNAEMEYSSQNTLEEAA